MDTDRIGLFVQGSALLVALSVICGRIFVLARDQALGLAAPSLQLNAIDNAIASPNVTIMSVGLSVYLVFYWFWRPPRRDFWRWDLSIYGVALLALGLTMASTSDLVQDFIPDSPGAWGFFSLIRIVSTYFGIALLLETIPRRLVRNYILGPTDEEANESRDQLRSVYPIIVGIYLIVMASTVLNFVWDEGKRDADRQLQDAPLAFVSYNTNQHHYSMLDPAQQTDTASVVKRPHKVLSIDNNFAYLLDPGTNIDEDYLPILVLPVTRIEAIEYIACTKPDCPISLPHGGPTYP